MYCGLDRCWNNSPARGLGLVSAAGAGAGARPPAWSVGLVAAGAGALGLVAALIVSIIKIYGGLAGSAWWPVLELVPALGLVAAAVGCGVGPAWCRAVGTCCGCVLAVGGVGGPARCRAVREEEEVFFFLLRERVKYA